MIIRSKPKKGTNKNTKSNNNCSICKMLTSSGIFKVTFCRTSLKIHLVSHLNFLLSSGAVIERFWLDFHQLYFERETSVE